MIRCLWQASVQMRITCAISLIYLLLPAAIPRACGDDALYDAAIRAGEDFSKNRQELEARTAYSDALGLATTPDQKAKAQLGVARSFLYGGGSLSKVRDEYAKVIAIDHSDPEIRIRAQFAIAHTYFTPWTARVSQVSSNEVTQARLEYAKILEFNGLSSANKAQALTDIAGCYIQEKNRAEAVATLQKVLELKDFNAQNREYWQNQTHITLGDIAAGPAPAREAYTHALRIANNDETRQLALGRIAGTYRTEGNKEQERATYARVLELQHISTERLAEAQIAIGRTYETEKKFEQARDEYSKVLAIKDVTPYSEAYAHFLIAKTHLAEEQRDKARREFRKVLSIIKREDVAPALRKETERQLRMLP